MYSLENLTTDVNNALNYPAISFSDIKLYLNQAISEINSTLHIQIRDVNAIINENNSKLSDAKNVVYLATVPVSIPTASAAPLDSNYYYDAVKYKYGIKDILSGEWSYFDEIYGVNIVNNERKFYKATVVAQVHIWVAVIADNPFEVDLLDYLPMDWITLFIIPYICFKFSARDNDTGSIFSEEFTQGYQQLLTAYNVPFQVHLDKVAGQRAYITDVKEHIDNLKVLCPCRRIADYMQVPRDIKATFGSVYNEGGWGV